MVLLPFLLIKSLKDNAYLPNLTCFSSVESKTSATFVCVLIKTSSHFQFIWVDNHVRLPSDFCICFTLGFLVVYSLCSCFICSEWKCTSRSISLHINNSDTGQTIPLTIRGIILETNINRDDGGSFHAEVIYNWINRIYYKIKTMSKLAANNNILLAEKFRFSKYR